jgi:hypothetical protein
VIANFYDSFQTSLIDFFFTNVFHGCVPRSRMLMMQYASIKPIKNKCCDVFTRQSRQGQLTYAMSNP